MRDRDLNPRPCDPKSDMVSIALTKYIMARLNMVMSRTTMLAGLISGLFRSYKNISQKKAGGRGRWPFWFAREKEGFPLILEGFTFGLGDEEVE